MPVSVKKALNAFLLSCNNAKSDVFSYEEFIEIGKAINRVKTRVG